MTREPEWDPESRARAMRLAEFELSLCPTHHIDRALCAEVRHDLIVDEVTDYTTRAVESYKAKRRAKVEATNPPKGTLPWDTGVEFRVRQHDPRRDKPLPEPKQPGGSARDDQVDHRPPAG